MADVLLGASAYETRLLVQRGIMQRTGCALAGPPLLARATLTLPLKSVPAALFTSLVLPSLLVSPELHTKLSPPLRNQKLSWQVFVRPEKCWQGPFSDTQEHKREGFSIHVPLCLDCLPLALPGPLPLLRVC